MTQSFYALRNVWKRWIRVSISREIFSVAVIVGVMTLLARVCGFFKEMVIAYRFGTSDELDAFLIALMLPYMGAGIISRSTRSALMPTYIEEREQKGTDAAIQLFSSVACWGISILSIVAILLVLVAPSILPILASGFPAEKLALTHSLFIFLIGILVIKGISSMWGAVLNAGHRFALAAFAPAMVPISTIIFLLISGSDLSIYTLAIGMVIGFVLEAGFQGWHLKRLKFPLLPRLPRLDLPMRQVFKQFWPALAGAFLMSSTTLIDQSMAAMTGSSGVAALNYGNKIVAFMLGIGAIALNTAVLPYFSKMVVDNNWLTLRSVLRTYTGLVLVVSVPAMMLVIYSSAPIIALIFQRGAFTAEDTHLVSAIQSMYVLQLPFYILSILMMRIIVALKENYFLFWVSACNVPLNIGLNYLFMQFLGLKGIALSTSIVYLFSWAFLTVVAYRKMRQREREAAHG